MKEHDIVAAVAESAHIDEHDAAERAVRSTLRVLGQRLAGGQTANLAAQLPDDLGSVLPSEGSGERFGLAEFYRRVAEDEGVAQEQARQHARATMHAVNVAVTDAEFEKVAAQLPDEYADLLGTEPVQHH